MKPHFFVLLFSLVVMSVCAQTTEWTKSDAQTLYEEAMSILSKYPIKQEQKEAISLCYKNEITRQITKAEYNLKIEPELKIMRSTYITQCAKSAGVELVETKPDEPTKTVTLSVAGLSGMWEFEGRRFTFTEGGTYLYDGSNKKCTGQWHLNNKTITLNPDNSVANKFALCGNEEFEIVSFNPNQVDLLKTGARSVSNFKKVK
jgi:hypothetical protein